MIVIIGSALAGPVVVLWLGTLNPRSRTDPPFDDKVTGLKLAPASTEIQLPANTLLWPPGVFQPEPWRTSPAGTVNVEVTRYVPAGK